MSKRLCVCEWHCFWNSTMSVVKNLWSDNQRRLIIHHSLGSVKNNININVFGNQYNFKFSLSFTCSQSTNHIELVKHISDKNVVWVASDTVCITCKPNKIKFSLRSPRWYLINTAFTSRRVKCYILKMVCFEWVTTIRVLKQPKFFIILDFICFLQRITKRSCSRQVFSLISF